MERIVIEIVGDTTKLQSTIDQLQKLGQVDKENSERFKKTNNEAKTQYQQVTAKLQQVTEQMREFLITGQKVPEKLQKEFNSLNNAIKKVDDSLKKTNKDTQQGLAATTKDVGYLNNQIQNLGNTIAGAFAVGALVQFGSESLKVSAKIDSVGKSLEYIVGGARRAGENLEWLTKLTDKLGLEFVSTASSFKLFAGSAIQSGLTLKNTQEIFESVSKAVVTMGLSAEDAEGVFLALSQIMSKGTVSAEELRGQIGERIPGAFAIAAKSIGVTEQQLNKMLAQGQILSKDFLPKFAKQLETDLGGGAEKAADGMQANLNRLTNMWTDFKNFFGANIIYPLVAGMKGVFVDTPKMLLDDLSRIFKKKSVFEAIPELGAQLQAVQDNFTRLEVRIANAKTRKELVALGNTTNKYFNTLDKGLSEAANGRYLSVMDQLADKYNSLSKAQASGVSSTEKATKAKKEEAAVIEKLPTAYEQLVKAASDLEAAMRNTLALNGIVSPKAIAQLDDLKMKIQTIEIAMKNLNDPLLKSAGGKPLGVTSDLPNELPTGDFGESAQKAEYDALLGLHEDFLSELGSQDQMYTEAYLNELEKRKAAQQENQQLLINGTFQLLEMSANAFYDAVRQSDQAATDFQLANLKELYDSKSITEKEYEEKRKRILNEDAQRQHEMAIYQAATQAALGILYAMQGDPYTLAARVAVAAAIGLAQTAIVAAQPVPQFAEGTDRVRGGVKGKDSVHALLMPDEAVIKTSENMKYPGLAKAWNEGKLEDYVMSNFMLPMINPKNYELEQQKSFAENVANSIVLNQDFGTLESKLKKIEQAEREGAAFIAKEVSRAINNNQRSGY